MVSSSATDSSLDITTASSQNDSSNSSSRLETALLQLQPIRDLARNWDVDIASCLEDVLNELAIPTNFPNNTDPNSNNNPDATNFAQAALLLQNAGFVYSRKVEYLYALVYQALKDLQSTTRNANENDPNNPNNKQRKKVGELEEFDNFDPEVQFLLLDDILPTEESSSSKINIKDVSIDDEENRQSRVSFPSSRKLDLDRNDATMLNQTVNQTRLSLGMTMTPTSMNSSTRDAVLMGNIRKQIDLLSGGGGGGGVSGSNQLRLVGNGCDMSACGALLMPGSNIGGNRDYEGGDGNDMNSVKNDTGGLFGVNPPITENANESENNQIHENDNYEDHDNDGMGFDFGGANDHDMDDNNHHGEDEKVEDHDSPPLQEIKTTADTNDVSPPIVPLNDPWELLDPHDAGKTKPRPLKVGITYVLPPGLMHDVGSSVTGSGTRRRAMVRGKNRRKNEFGGEFGGKGVETFEAAIAEQARRRRRRNATGEVTSYASGIDIKEHGRDPSLPKGQSSFSGTTSEIPSASFIAPPPPIKLTGLAYGEEFAYIAKANARRKMAQVRARRKSSLAEVEISRSKHATNAAANAGVCIQEDHHGDDDDYNDFCDFAGDPEDNSHHDNSHHDNFDNINNQHYHKEGNISPACFENAFASAPTHALDHDDNGVLYEDSQNVAQAFEALCRAHIKAFAKGAEKYAAETQLSKRVSDWQTRLAPTLQQEEARPDFDIHMYGKKIVSRVKDEINRGESTCQQKANVVNFQVVTQESEPWEVCRLFLSSLMLCNSKNVVLSHEEGAVTSTDALQIELMEEEVSRPMETFKAPSVADSVSVLAGGGGGVGQVSCAQAQPQPHQILPRVPRKAVQNVR